MRLTWRAARWAAAATFVYLTACHPAPEPAITVRKTATAGGFLLTLVAAPGARINAKNQPALELKDGTVLRFDSSHLSADSSYYADAPSLAIPGPVPPQGRIRAGVCLAGESVCRVVEVVMD
jgi:hypothetical protein